MEKKGQIAIFIIIALVIVAVLIVVLVVPRGSFGTSSVLSPTAFLSNCLKPEVELNVAALGKTGGYRNPTGVIVYNGSAVKYLCYTAEDYKTCVVQQPFIVEQFRKELETSLRPSATTCFQNLISEYDRKGYSVNAGEVKVNVSIVLQGISVDFIAPLTITRIGNQEESQTFSHVAVTIASSYYELLYIAESIVGFEATYGDSETTAYLQYYPNLKIEKTVLSEGSTIYKLSDVVTEERFTFASRSVAWPPGYGTTL